MSDIDKTEDRRSSSDKFQFSYNQMLDEARKKLPDIKKSNSRFELPKAVIDQTGRQTVIKNFSDIAKSLRREPKHIAKFLFKELAVAGSVSGAALTMQGKISRSLVDQRIGDYAKKFVLCHECGKPDTIMDKCQGIFFIKCEACGARRSVE